MNKFDAIKLADIIDEDVYLFADGQLVVANSEFARELIHLGLAILFVAHPSHDER